MIQPLRLSLALFLVPPAFGCGGKPTDSRRVPVPEYVASWGSTGQPYDAWLYDPVSIAVAPDGEVLVADTQKHRIQVYASEGTPLDVWGAEGRGPGELSLPTAVSVDGNGIVYVTDFGYRLQTFTLAGEFLSSMDFYSSVNGLWGLEEGGVALSGVEILERDPRLITGPPSLFLLTAEGEILTRRDPAPTGAICRMEGGEYAVATILPASDGEHLRSEIFILGSDGRMLRSWVVSEPDRGVVFEGVVSADGLLYVPDWVNNAGVRIYDPSGTSMGSWISAGEEEPLNKVSGIAADRSGFLYVLDYGHDRVVKYRR